MADISRLPGPVADVWEWQFDGACRDADPTTFFHPEGERGPTREARDRAAKAGLRHLSGGRSVRGSRPLGPRAVRSVGRHDREKTARPPTAALPSNSSSSRDDREVVPALTGCVVPRGRCVDRSHESGQQGHPVSRSLRDPLLPDGSSY